MLLPFYGPCLSSLSSSAHHLLLFPTCHSLSSSSPACHLPSSPTCCLLSSSSPACCLLPSPTCPSSSSSSPAHCPPLSPSSSLLWSSPFIIVVIPVHCCGHPHSLFVVIPICHCGHPCSSSLSPTHCSLSSLAHLLLLLSSPSSCHCSLLAVVVHH